jgi:hypothetical protein
MYCACDNLGIKKSSSCSKCGLQKFDVKTKDPALFPRCEYYTRYEGSTYFSMDEYQFWNTYHRSEHSRSFQLLKGHYVASHLHHQQGQSFYAHAGSYENPFQAPYYAKKFQSKTQAVLKKMPPAQAGYFYNHLLEHRKATCRIIIVEFERLMKEQGKPRIQKVQKMAKVKKSPNFEGDRTIVYMDNDYPCILVSMPFMNRGFLGRTSAIQKESPQYASVEFWSEHSKVFQDLLMAYYVAIVNYHADRSGIPIELVMRSSFGQFQPSISETARSFRINVGIIPQQYAKLLATGLYHLYCLFETFTDEFPASLVPDADPKHTWWPERTQYITDYIFDSIELTEERRDEIFENNVWWTLRIPTSHRNNHSFLYEMLREKINRELLANLVLKQLLETEQTDMWPLALMFNYLEYKTNSKKQTVTSFSDKVKEEYSSNTGIWQKRKWSQSQPIPDPNFWQLTDQICMALSGKTLSHTSGTGVVLGLYAYLEKLHIDFMKKYCRSPVKADSDEEDSERSELEQDEENQLGSDSEEEGNVVKGKKIYAKKIITVTGLMAISYAGYAARWYVKKILKKDTYQERAKYMYYETAGNLELLNSISDLKINGKSHSKILYFDLNYCNALNEVEGIITLENEITGFQPKIIILDYTSATTVAVNKALQAIFGSDKRSKADLVLLVSSGLKNESGGANHNPYGTLRIMCSRQEDLNSVYDKLVKLIQKDKHFVPLLAHQIRRNYKAQGFVPTNASFIQQKASPRPPSVVGPPLPPISPLHSGRRKITASAGRSSYISDSSSASDSDND